MQRLVRIDSLFKNCQGEELIEALCDIYPEGRCGNAGHAFRSDLPDSDDRTQRLLQALESAGLSHAEPSNLLDRDRSKTYVLRYHRVYDQSDLEQCEYLELAGAPGVEGEWPHARKPTAEMEAPGESEVVFMFPRCFIFVEWARRALESEGLLGLVFHPVDKLYESVDYDLYDEEDIWWNLRSELVLPPLSPTMTFVTYDNEPFDGDFDKGCFPRDGLYTRAEMYYKREDIESFPEFDVALTWERFGGRKSSTNYYGRAFVVSQKFYQACLKHNIRCGFCPVHLEN